MNDAFAQLMDDHREVERLFASFEQTGDYEVALEVCRELTVHALLEEELIYPLYRSKVDQGGGVEAEKEHQEAKEIIQRIEALEAGDPAVAEAMSELKASVTHHVQEEENELFPRMETAISAITDSLGEDVRLRKEDLLGEMAEDQSLGLNPSATGNKPMS